LDALLDDKVPQREIEGQRQRMPRTKLLELHGGASRLRHFGDTMTKPLVKPMTGAEAFSPSPVFVRQDGSTATADMLLAELQRVAADVRAAVEGHVFPNVEHADVLLDALSVCTVDLATVESRYFDLDTL
jgi:hypothetical protein